MFFYRTYLPCAALTPYVCNFSIIENTDAVAHHIVPRAAFILGILYKGGMELATASGNILDARFQSGLMGLQDRYRLFRKKPGTGMLAVNFTPTGAAAFFRLPLDALFNHAYALNSFFKASIITELEEQVTLAAGAAERIQVLEAFLLNLLKTQKQDLLINAGVAKIDAVKGILRAEELAKALHISPGRLEKRFRETVGTTPKKYASMIRMAAVLKAFRTEGPLTALAYEFGYFDQAHFNHDFRAYTGYTPKQLSTPAIRQQTDQPPCGFVYASDMIMKNGDR